MSWLGELIGGGVSETLSSVGEAAKDIEDVFTTSDRERLSAYEAQTDRILANQTIDREQIRANATEARHRSLFVAGWRPFIGWVCGIAMCYHFLVFPSFGALLSELTGVDLLEMDWKSLSVVLLGMLGLGAYRSYEKKQGIASHSMEG